MADLDIIRSLSSIESGHPVFEPDQVLTDRQLNGVIDYFDDQGRLTRVALLGVGLLAGLQVSTAANKVALSKGLGVTTDGDLLVLPAATIFDRFKPYADAAPKYPPFYTGNTMRTVYELVPEGQVDAAALPLTSLPAPGLSELVVVFLMESYEKDQDLCSGTDCDNLGRDALHTQRVLLISRADAAATELSTEVSTVTGDAGLLPVVAAGRPALTGSLNTTGALATLYRTACLATHAALVSALPTLHQRVPALTAQLFGGDPSAPWIARLNTIRNTFQANSSGIQYFYGFLKDVAETWNTLREVLLENECVICPELTAFPKHLLLGAVSNLTELRTQFYPSPLTADPRGQIDHALSLAWKLHVLINTFTVPVTAGAAAVRVTPSRSELESLEERAIPYYYGPSTPLSILKSWSYRLAKLGASDGITAYYATELGGNASARDPFAGQIGRYDFFRVEGHLGQDVDVVMDELERLIRVRNLPFVVRAVLLHDSTGKLKRKPPIRYGDLHRIHKVVRAELDSELSRSATFSGVYNQSIKTAAGTGQIPNDGTKLAQAETYNATIQSSVGESRKAFAKPTYTEFKSDNSWAGQYETALSAAGGFKRTFGDTSRTDYVTSFDSAIASNHKAWLAWLDVLIDDKNQKADERSLFTNYLAKHPGLEHFAGVLRGGTFVVVYDDAAHVVADFMLPYRDVEEVEPEPQEPVLVDSPPSYVTGGAVVVEPLELQFEGLKVDIRQEWTKEIDIQEGYMDFFQENVDILTKVVPRTAQSAKDAVAGIGDPLAKYYAGIIADEMERLEQLKALVLDVATPAEARKDLAKQQEQLEMQLADSVTTAATYFAQTDLGTSQGSSGAKTLEIAAQGAGRISNDKARQRLGEGLKSAQQVAKQDAQKVQLTNLGVAQNLRF